MHKTTIQLSTKLVDTIKILKKQSNKKSYEELLGELVKTELRKYCAFTKDGYLPVGTVVSHEGVPLVIKAIQGGRVIFNDFTFTLNGGGSTYHLDFLAPSLEEYEGGRKSV